MTWATAKDLAGLPFMPGTDRSVRRLAEREGWPSRRYAVQGGYVLRYRVDALPDATRTALAVRGAANDDAPAQPVGVVAATAAGRQIDELCRVTDRAAGTAATAAVTGERARERDDKLRLLVAFRRFWDVYGGALSPALQAFRDHYNGGRVEVPASVRGRWPRLGRWETVRDWWHALDRQGGAGLTRAAAHNAGRSAVFDGALGQFVLATLHEKPHLSGQALHRLAAKTLAAGLLQIEGDLPSLRSFQRAVPRWKRDNKQLFTAITNPDKWRSHYLAAAGSRSEGIGLNDLWEMDGTKADLLLADGRRWTLTVMVDVGTRDALVRLSPTARAAVVMGLTRRALVEWGKPKVLKTDNGSDYTAEQYELGLTQIDPDMHVLCDPYQPQQKPHVERFIGTLLHDLFELLPGFIGHSVAERKDIEARRSFAERMQRGSPDGGPVELRLQPEQLQAILEHWLEDYRNREHAGLGGKTPNQMRAEFSGTVYRIDERALDIFLAPAGKAGMAAVQKKGIRIDHGWFNCAEIGGLEGQQVQVRQTEEDLGVCYVFDLAGRYVGTAINHAARGVSAAEVADERREHQKRFLAEQKAALREHVKAVKPNQLVMEVLTRKTAAAVDAALNVTRLVREAAHVNDAIASVTAPNERSASQLSAAQIETLARIEAGQEPVRAPVLRLDTPNARYSAWLRLQARMAAGEAVEPRDIRWADGYAASAECKAMQRLHQGSDPLAVNWDVQAGG